MVSASTWINVSQRVCLDRAFGVIQDFGYAIERPANHPSSRGGRNSDEYVIVTCREISPGRTLVDAWISCQPCTTNVQDVAFRITNRMGLDLRPGAGAGAGPGPGSGPAANPGPVSAPKGRYLSLDKPLFSRGEQVTIKWRGFPFADRGEWITVVQAGTPDNQGGAWATIKRGGGADGEYRPGDLAPGTWEARVFSSKGYTSLIDRVSFTVR
jgi:hypothetical protein